MIIEKYFEENVKISEENRNEIFQLQYCTYTIDKCGGTVFILCYFEYEIIAMTATSDLFS